MDRGAGMGPEILDRIQKPYYTTKEGGSGLGIAVARGIIEQHGGTLKFESSSGRGTTATVHLPACAREAQNKKTKLPNPCRSAFASALEPFTGKKSDGIASAGAAAVASMGAQPEKVPS
jgi:hypothetical protein